MRWSRHKGETIDRSHLVVPPDERCIRSTSSDGWPRCGRCGNCVRHSERVMASLTDEERERYHLPPKTDDPPWRAESAVPDYAVPLRDRGAGHTMAVSMTRSLLPTQPSTWAEGVYDECIDLMEREPEPVG